MRLYVGVNKTFAIRYLPTKMWYTSLHFLFNAENTNFCIFHAYTYFVTADHE